MRDNKGSVSCSEAEPLQEYNTQSSALWLFDLYLFFKKFVKVM